MQSISDVSSEVNDLNYETRGAIAWDADCSSALGNDNPPATHDLQSERAETDKFLLAAFGTKDAWLSYQTADDNKKGPKDPGLKRSIFGIHDQLAPQLVKLNADGAAVWVGVTKTKGDRRKKENVNGVWTVPLDLDEGAQAKLDIVMGCERPPNIVVESSPDKAQCHWINDGSVLSPHFEPLLKRLIAKFGGDPAVCSLTQVMRLPGYWHRKDRNNPFMVRIIHLNTDPSTTGNTLLADLLKITADVDAVAVAVPTQGVSPKRVHNQASHLAPSLGHVAKALEIFPNTPENIPSHRDQKARVDFVRVAAGVSGATGGDEDFYAEVFEPWALQYPENTPEYVRERWDSVKKDGVDLGWTWLSAVTGCNTRFGTGEAFAEPADMMAMDAAIENPPDDFSENQLARRFADLHHDGVRYTAKEGQWLEWNETRWCPDEKLHMMTRTRQFCRQVAHGGGY